VSHMFLFNRFIQSPPWPWVAITTSIGIFVIGLLVGYIIYATAKRIARVEDDFQQMSLLKKRAEDADIAKSQVISFATNNSYACFVLLFLLDWRPKA